MKKFKFNKYGICKNPVKEKIRDDEKYLLKIEYACVNKKKQWAFGCNYRVKGPEGAGGSFGVCNKKKKKNNPFFNYKHTCRKAALRYLLDEIKYFSLPKELKQQLQQLINKIPGEQLKLF